MLRSFMLAIAATLVLCLGFGVASALVSATAEPPNQTVINSPRGVGGCC